MYMYLDRVCIYTDLAKIQRNFPENKGFVIILGYMYTLYMYACTCMYMYMCVYHRIWLISACAYNSKWKGNMRLYTMYVTTPTNIWAWQQWSCSNSTTATTPVLSVEVYCFSLPTALSPNVQTRSILHCDQTLARSRFSTLPRLFSACTCVLACIQCMKRVCTYA